MMRFRNSLIVLLSSSALLAACGTSDRDDEIGGVSASEAQALNEAAEMLDSRRIATARALKSEPVPGNSNGTSNSKN